MHKGGKKSILNSVVKRNLNFSAKAKMTKHVVQARSYPHPSFPSTQDVEDMLEIMTGKSCTSSITGVRSLLTDFKMIVKRTRVFLWFIKVD